MENQIYSNECGTFMAIYLTWEEVLDVLGHIHTGSRCEDEALMSYCIEQGAPQWCADAEGFVDDGGWGLIGPQILQGYFSHPMEHQSILEELGLNWLKKVIEDAIVKIKPLPVEDGEPEQVHKIQAIEVRPSDCVCGGWDILLRIESAVAGTTLAVSESAQGIVTLMPCRYDGSPQSDWAYCPSLWVESQLLDYVDAEGIDLQELEAVAADAIRSTKVDPS